MIPKVDAISVEACLHTSPPQTMELRKDSCCPTKVSKTALSNIEVENPGAV